MSDDFTPCDVEPPCDVREIFATLVAARQRFNDAKVTDLTDYRRKRIMEQQLGHDLANAFRSMELAKPDGDAS
jgi:hypothetical protein